jgi:hypothetical protein
MSLFFKLVLLFVFIFQSAHLSAGEVTPTEKDPQDVKAVLNQFHNDIEHSEIDGESKTKLYSLLSQWIANFNFSKITLDAHRSVQMRYYQDGGQSEYIRNLPVLASLHLVSHFIEASSGPVGVYLASQLGFGSSVQIAIGTIGAIITVPGLDPLCIILLAVSPFKPVQKTMTAIRLVAVKVYGGVSNMLHLQEAMNKLLENKDRLSEIIKTSPNTDLSLVYDSKSYVLLKQLSIKSPEGKPYLNLTFQEKAGKTWVTALEVLDTQTLNQNKKALDRIMKQFNVSVRYALQRAIKVPRKTFYIDSVETTEISTNIQFKDYGVVVKPKVALRKQTQIETAPEIVRCQGLFH